MLSSLVWQGVVFAPGLLVTRVAEDGSSGAEGDPIFGGLRSCDLIIGIEGHPVRGIGDYLDLMTMYHPGDMVSVRVRRYPPEKCTDVASQDAAALQGEESAYI